MMRIVKPQVSYFVSYHYKAQAGVGFGRRIMKSNIAIEDEGSIYHLEKRLCQEEGFVNVVILYFKELNQ